MPSSFSLWSYIFYIKCIIAKLNFHCRSGECLRWPWTCPFLSATSDVLIEDITFSHQGFLLLLFLDHHSYKSTTTSFNYFRQHETAFMGPRKPLLRIAYSLVIMTLFWDMWGFESHYVEETIESASPAAWVSTLIMSYWIKGYGRIIIVFSRCILWEMNNSTF